MSALDIRHRAGLKAEQKFRFWFMVSAAPKTLQPMLEWIRPPQQARTRESLSRFLDAAEGLLAENGFDGMAVVDVAQAAGSSVGGFYRRFRDKDGLLHALHERFCEEARATADAALDPTRWEGTSTVAVLDEFCAFLVRIYRDREGLLRAFLYRGVADARVRERTDQLFEHVAGRLRDLLHARADEIGHPNPGLAASFGLHVVLGTLNHLVQVPPAALQLSDNRIASELARVFRNYLGATPHSRSSRRIHS
jgi:AcrR family transcriptional regulator